MGDTLLRIAACLATTALLFAATYKPLGALAQGGYKNGKFFRWIRRKDNLFYNRLCLLTLLCGLSVAVVSLAFSFWGANVSRALSAIPFFLFWILFVIADRKYALKLPVRATARLKRLAGVYVFVCLCFCYLFLSALFFLERAVGKDLYTLFAYVPFCALPLFFPPLMAFANLLTSPFENGKNKKFVERMGQVLNETEILRVGITGSYGKTSVKNVLKTLLEEKYTVLATPESYNTPIGIAKTVQDGDLAGAQILIAEMGARQMGDIKELCELVKPDFGILTGVCAQHIETFSSEDNVFAEKTELVKAAKKTVCGRSVYEKLKENEACIPVLEAQNLQLFAERTEFDFAVDGKLFHVKTKLLGESAAENILLAATLCLQLGMTGEEILRGVERLEYIPHRLALSEVSGGYILDDGYNASERSAKEAVAALKRFSCEKTVVTPGIVEAGILEEKINRDLGALFVGLDRVILVGETLVGAVKSGYLSAGGDPEKLFVVPTLESAKAVLRDSWKGVALFLNDLPDVY